MLDITGFGPAKINYSSYLLPGMIAMTIMQTGIYGLAYWMIDLKQRGVLKRFMVTPLSPAELIGSLILTRMIVMLVQLIALISIGHYFFGVEINGSLLAIVVFAALGGVAFLTVGFLVSVVSNTYDEAAPITTIVNLMFTFLGNVFFPAEVLPKILKTISEKLPLTYMAEGMRNNFIKNQGFADSLGQMVALLTWSLVIFTITYYAFNKKRE